MHGAFEDYNGPIVSGNDLYSRVMRSDPVAFPAYYAPDAANAYKEHILLVIQTKGSISIRMQTW